MTFACPVCHGELTAGRCAACARGYAERDGFPDFRVPDRLAADRLELSHRIAGELQRWRETRPASDCAAGAATLAQFLAFINAPGLRGPVLDLGCKDGNLADRLPGPTEYAGVDPFLAAPAAARTLNLAWAYAEYLPFPDGVFAHAFALATLDYFIEPARGIAEAHRVLAPGGRLHLMIGVHARDWNELRARRWLTLGGGVRDLAGGRLTGAGFRKLGFRLFRAKRRHVSYFTAAALRELLAGYFAIERESQPPGGDGTMRFITTIRRDPGRQ